MPPWDPGRRAMQMPSGLQPGKELPWPTLLTPATEGLIVAHDYGNAYAPDCPSGRTRLELHPDGRLELGWWQGEAHRYFTARCAPALVARFLDAMRAGGFPFFPAHPILPGISFRVIDARVGLRGVQALAARHPLDDVEPFSTLRVLGEGLSAAIFPGALVGYAPPPPDAVRDVAEWA
ncbi:MAG: hypothetical protein H6740_07555 [Alphaproteobacteria bacterium]|nr:hypothetical protein [Alphaproteobacteria bacterium]